jgi:hypothetical protein
MMSSLQGENLFYPIPAVDLQKKTLVVASSAWWCVAWCVAWCN